MVNVQLIEPASCFTASPHARWGALEGGVHVAWTRARVEAWHDVADAAAMAAVWPTWRFGLVPAAGSWVSADKSGVMS